MNIGYDLRYPIGDFSPSHPLAQLSRMEQIEVLRRLPEEMRRAVSGLSEGQLDTPYREGGWTVRQTVHHVADSHMNAYVRVKLALTEDTPTIKPYEEAGWAQLPDSRLPVEVSLLLLEALHARWVALFAAMSDGEFTRAYQHPERGPQNLVTVLGLYAWHARHHLTHITNLRERMGW